MFDPAIVINALLLTMVLSGVQKDETAFSKKIDIGGREILINCSARPRDQRPTIVLEAGLNQGSESWRSVQTAAARFARVCSYDRAGIGQSDAASPRPRTSRQIVEDLRLLLKRADVSPPYILVGHSFGGVNARLFASTYPKDVVGMVLVDSVHEDETQELMKILPADVRKTMESSADNRSLGGEAIDLEASFKQMREARWRTNVPLKVIARGQASFTPDDYAPLLRPFASRGEALRVKMQKDLAARSSRGEFLFAEKSGHMIHLDQPEMIVEAIQKVLAETKPNAPRKHE